MLIRAIQVRRFDNPGAEALAMASRRMRCTVSDLEAEPLENGDWNVTYLASKPEFWVRHVATGKYLTIMGLVSSLEFDGARIAGYHTVQTAKIALQSLAVDMRIAWDDVEMVTCGG